MYEYKQSVTRWAPVRIIDSLGNPVTGIAFGSITASVLKSDTTVVAFAVTGADWFEATTSAFASQGVYAIQIPGSVLDVTGMLTYAVSSGGAGQTYIGSVKVVSYEAADINSYLNSIAGSEFFSTTDSLRALRTILETIDSSTGSAAIAAAVWDEILALHLNPNSTGEKLNNTSTVGAGEVASAVWDENLPSHLLPDSTGEKLNSGSGGGSGVSFLSNGDTVNPIIIQVSSPKHTQVKVTFSEPVVMTTDANGALNPANYSIPGVTVIAVSSLTSQQVLITTSAQTPNFLYTLTITNVEDLVGNPIL